MILMDKVLHYRLMKQVTNLYLYVLCSSVRGWAALLHRSYDAALLGMLRMKDVSRFVVALFGGVEVRSCW